MIHINQKSERTKETGRDFIFAEKSMTRVEDPAAPVRRAATKLMKGGRDESTDGPHNNSLIQGISGEARRGNCTCTSILHSIELPLSVNWAKHCLVSPSQLIR